MNYSVSPVACAAGGEQDSTCLFRCNPVFIIVIRQMNWRWLSCWSGPQAAIFFRLYWRFCHSNVRNLSQCVCPMIWCNFLWITEC